MVSEIILKFNEFAGARETGFSARKGPPATKIGSEDTGQIGLGHIATLPAAPFSSASKQGILPPTL